jgi:hypothetical protein
MQLSLIRGYLHIDPNEIDPPTRHLCWATRGDLTALPLGPLTGLIAAVVKASPAPKGGRENSWQTRMKVDLVAVVVHCDCLDNAPVLLDYAAGVGRHVFPSLCDVHSGCRRLVPRRFIWQPEGYGSYCTMAGAPLHNAGDCGLVLLLQACNSRVTVLCDGSFLAYRSGVATSTHAPRIRGHSVFSVARLPDLVGSI